MIPKINMNIFEQAMEIESEGMGLYRDFALEAPNRGMENIFTWLAEQEQKHYKVFKAMKFGKPATVAESTVLSDVKKIFEEWKDQTPCIEVNAPQTVLYRKALAVEKKSVEIYEKYAETAPAPQKEIFQMIARQEKGHQVIMENIIEIVSKPEVWAENAEFSHLDEDYYL